MLLPNGERAIVDIAKLKDYCLNPQHADGKNKARVFAAALGIGRDDAEWLRSQLLRVAASEPAFITAQTRFGTLYVLDFRLTGRSGSVTGEERLDCQSDRGFPAPYYLFCEEEWNTMKLIPLLAVVALTDDLPEHKLTRGQIGTVVEHLHRDGDDALLVEFSDEQGEAYAIAPVRPDQLIALHRKTEAA